MKSQYPSSGQVSNTSLVESCVAEAKMEAKIDKTTPDSEKPDNAKSVSAVYTLVYCIYNTLYMWVMLNYGFMCGLNRLKVTGVCLTIAAIANFLLAWWLATYDSTWVSIIVATAIAIIPCAFAIPLDLRCYLETLTKMKAQGEAV
ncbi:hypothetical protein [Adlercreutzia sp. ZJ304]|uniref:hypothetical protein n=1 Tax=Adlercreutzia sp. ZJ304 TaxID=2709791 RepID=UPI0013EC293D|nr:hypothetical protein [Adlercreutzia sp. ZJ304]